MSTGIYKINKSLYESYKDLFNSITFGDPSEVDMDKQVILPLMHISISNIVNTENSKTINYQIVILDVIDSNDLDPREMKNDFHLSNNLEDVIHDLDYRFVKGWGGFRSLVDESPSSVNLELLYASTKDKLVGYEINFSIITSQNGYC